MPKFKFGDIAINCTEKRKPTEADMATYIGLEHLDSGSLTVHRFGSAVPIKGDKTIMHKGDILFGKRNAYLKRAAIAPHDGLFSAHGMVLRPKENVVDKDFFPHFINSDYFFDEAIRISVGSLSPTINWIALKELEFELPSLEKQRSLARILWAINRTSEAYKVLLARTADLVKSQFVEMFGDPIENPKGWPTIGLLEIGNCKNGMNFGHNEEGYTVHCIGVSDFKDNLSISNTSNIPMISVNSKPSTELLLQDGDILFVRSNGNKELVGRSLLVYPGDIKTTFSGFCIRYRLNTEKVISMFVLYFLRQETVRKLLQGRGANIQNLNQKIIASISVFVPPMELQKAFVQQVQQLDKSKFELEHTLKELAGICRRIIVENLG